MKISNEAKVGALTLISIIVLILGYNFLKGQNLFVKETHYYAIYDNIDGLKKSDIITLNGFRVGRIDDIQLMDNRSGRIIVRLAVKPELEMPRRSIARIVSTDLLGSKSISLIYSDSPNLHEPGDTLIADIQGDLADEVRREILPVKNRAEDLLGSIDSLFIAARSILEEGQIVSALQHFENAIESLASTTGTLDTLMAEESNKIAIIFDNIESITGNLRENNEELSNFLQNISTLSDSLVAADLKQVIDNAEGSLNELNTLLTEINEGDGTLSMLINDEELYENLKEASKNLDDLLIDVKENPQRYIRFSIFGRAR